MAFTSLDLTTAVFPFGTGAIDGGGAIVSASPGDTPEFVIPGTVLDAGTYYEFQLDFDSYDETATEPYVFIAPTSAAESGTSYDELGEAFHGDGTGNPQTISVYMGPGIHDWDTNVPLGLDHVWFFVEADLRVTAIRYRPMVLTPLSDWLDDADPVWQNVSAYPSPARYVVGMLNSDSPATMENVWSGAGEFLEEDTYDVSVGGILGASWISSADIFSLGWNMGWLTVKRTIPSMTVSTGILPESAANAFFVEWEPSSTPNDQQLEIEVDLAAASIAGNTHIKIVSGLPVGPLYAPGFLTADVIRAMPDLVNVVLTGVSHTTVVVDNATLIAAGVPLLGATQFAVAGVDRWTQSGVWSYGDPSVNVDTKIHAFPSAGYRLRYKARFLVPAEISVAPPCQLYPRDDDQGVGNAAIWPPPSSSRPGSYY